MDTRDDRRLVQTWVKVTERGRSRMEARWVLVDTEAAKKKQAA